MKRRTASRPLQLLAGVLVVYLTAPVAAFLLRAGGSRTTGFSTPGLWAALTVSVIAATVATATVTVFGVPLAFYLARASSGWSRAVGVAVQLPLALPPLMGGILLIYLVGPYTAIGRLFGGRLTNSIAGVVLAQTFVAAPFLVISARSAFAAADPALDEVAATLGHRAWARFARVSVPAAGAAIGAGMLLTWLRAFGEYGATVLLAYHPYSLPVFTDVQFSGFGLAPTVAPTLLALLVAAAAVTVSRAPGRVTPFLRARRQHLWTPAPPVSDPVQPEVTSPRNPTAVPLSFRAEVTLGAFHLAVAHQARSSRLAILGPSGSGKSLTLRALTGLLGGSTGALSLGSLDLSRADPERRRIGYVPQSLGLFPHRSVWEQITFATQADPVVAANWIAALGLSGLENRTPQQLSGGQAQRVALARALSADPQLLLLDEPFSSLDAPLRSELATELRQLQLRTGLPSVLVTHDPNEAFLLADEVVIIASGRILQAGVAAEVMARPASAEVARILGITNFNSGRTVTRGEIEISNPSITIAVDHRLDPDTRVVWAVQPEAVSVSPDGRYEAEILDVVAFGAVQDMWLRLGESVLRARSFASGHQPQLRRGQRCRVDIDPGATMVWPLEPLQGQVRPET